MCTLLLFHNQSYCSLVLSWWFSEKATDIHFYEYTLLSIYNAFFFFVSLQFRIERRRCGLQAVGHPEKEQGKSDVSVLSCKYLNIQTTLRYPWNLIDVVKHNNCYFLFFFIARQDVQAVRDYNRHSRDIAVTIVLARWKGICTAEKRLKNRNYSKFYKSLLKLLFRKQL